MQRLQQPRKTCQMQERLPAALLTLQSSLLPYQTPWKWSMCYCLPEWMVILWMINDCQKATIPVSRGQRWSLRGFWGMGDEEDSPTRPRRSLNLQIKSKNLKKKECQARLRGKLGKMFLSAHSFYLTLTKRSLNLILMAPPSWFLSRPSKNILERSKTFAETSVGVTSPSPSESNKETKNTWKILEFITKYLKSTWIYNKIPGKYLNL